MTLAALDDAKRRGHDWGLHTSFCADTMTFIARVRRAGDASPHGTARVFVSVEAAVKWMLEELR